MTETAFVQEPGVSPIEPIERIDVSEAAYQRIREMIMLGDLAPDSKIDLGFLAHSFKVSRTTVAAALQRLNLEGLVEIVPRRGTLVRHFNPKQVKEMYEARLCFELWAADKGVSSMTDDQVDKLHRILDVFVPLFDSNKPSDLAAFAIQNRDFHTYLISLAKNEKMLDMYKGLHLDVLGYRIYYIRETRHSIDGRRIQEVLRPARADHDEHEAIARGYEARDLPQVREAITTHLDRAFKDYLRVAQALHPQ